MGPVVEWTWRILLKALAVSFGILGVGMLLIWLFAWDGGPLNTALSVIFGLATVYAPYLIWPPRL